MKPHRFARLIAAGLVRTASALGKTAEAGRVLSEVTNPLNAVKAVTKPASMAARVLGASPEVAAAIEHPAATGAVNLAKSLYTRALNPAGATTKQMGKLAETGLREGVGPADEAGLWRKVMGYDDKVKAMVAEGDKQGLMLDPEATRTAVSDKLLPSAAQGGAPGESFGVQAAPSADRARVQNVLDDWTNEHFTQAQPGTPPTVSPIAGPQGQSIITGPGTPPVPAKPIPIPIGEGNDIKSGTYKQLSKKAFGKSAAGATEPVPVASEQAQLEVARNLRKQIGDHLEAAGIGDVHGANAAEGDLLDLQPFVEKNAANAARSSASIKLTKGAFVNHMLPRVAMGLYKAGKMDRPTLNYIMKQAGTTAEVQGQIADEQ